MAYLYINAFFNFVIMTLNMIITKLMNNIGYYEINESVLYDIFYQMIDFNSDEGKVVAMYECFMDLDHRNNQGVTPLNPYLKMIVL